MFLHFFVTSELKKTHIHGFRSLPLISLGHERYSPRGFYSTLFRRSRLRYVIQLPLGQGHTQQNSLDGDGGSCLYCYDGFMVSVR